VTRTANGDKQASDALVERYAPLVWPICRRYQLSGADADDLGLAVCLQLAGQLGKNPRPSRACLLAGHLHSAGMRYGPARSTPTAGCPERANRRSRAWPHRGTSGQLTPPPDWAELADELLSAAF
jgi:hypothetical protein